MKHQTQTQNQRSYFKAQTSLEHLVDVTTRPRPSCVAQQVSIYKQLRNAKVGKRFEPIEKFMEAFNLHCFTCLHIFHCFPTETLPKVGFIDVQKRKIFAFEGQITILRKACLISDDSIDMKLHLALHHSNERKQELIPGFLYLPDKFSTSGRLAFQEPILDDGSGKNGGNFRVRHFDPEKKTGFFCFSDVPSESQHFFRQPHAQKSGPWQSLLISAVVSLPFPSHPVHPISGNRNHPLPLEFESWFCFSRSRCQSNNLLQSFQPWNSKHFSKSGISTGGAI